MEVQYRRKLDQTCLVFGGECPPDPYAVRVLEENRIPGILEMRMISVDQKDEFHFVVTGCQPLARLWEKKQIDISEIYLVLNAIYRIAKTLEDYLIDASHIMLKPEYIFVRRDISDIYVCCHPGYDGDFYAQIRELAQYFLNKIDHSDREGTRRAYEIYRITGEDFFSFEELLDMAKPDVEDAEHVEGSNAASPITETHDDGWDDAPVYKGGGISVESTNAVPVEEEDIGYKYAILGLKPSEMAATLIACACVGFGVYFFVRRGSLQKGCMMLAASLAIFIMIKVTRSMAKKERSDEEEYGNSADVEQQEESIYRVPQVQGSRLNEKSISEGRMDKVLSEADRSKGRQDESIYIPESTKESMSGSATTSYKPYAEQFCMSDSRPYDEEQYSVNGAIFAAEPRAVYGTEDALPRKPEYGAVFAAEPRAVYGTKDASVMRSEYGSDAAFASRQGAERAPEDALDSVATTREEKEGVTDSGIPGSHFLIRRDSVVQEGIRLWHMPFVIGSTKGNSDWLLGSQDADPVHVRLEEISGEYYLADIDSAKSICINGMPIQAGRRCQIKEGDEILIAGLRYVFQ